jgi:hypothetical protein
MNKTIWIGVGVAAAGVLGLGGYLMTQLSQTSQSGNGQGLGSSATARASGSASDRASGRASGDITSGSEGGLTSGSTGASLGAAAPRSGATDLSASQPEFLSQPSASNGASTAPLGLGRPNSGLAGLAGSSPAGQGLPIGKPGAPSIEGIQQRLQALVANGRQPTAKEVDAVLADLQKNQGSNVVGGVNIQAVRDNLARSDRIAQIAQEIQTIANQPSKADLPRLKSLTEEMQRLQTSMASPAANVAVGNPALVR